MEDLELEETNIRDFTYLKNYRPEMMSVKRLLGTHGSPKKVFSKISCGHLIKFSSEGCKIWESYERH